MTKVKKIRDRLGIYIGKLRVYLGISQAQLAQGLCTDAYLTRIESGEREADKLLTDALLQRLGKPADLFMRFLDEGELRSYRRRKYIVELLRREQWREVEQALQEYQEEFAQDSGILNRQFMQIIDLHLLHVKGVDREELDAKVLQTIRLTQPRYEKAPLSELLLSRNDGQLILAHLELQEEILGSEAIISHWHELLTYFRQPRYGQAERVYLAPFIVCHVIEYELAHGDYAEAWERCQEMLRELEEEQKLFGYEKLLQLKHKIAEEMKRDDEDALILARYLNQLQAEYGVSEKHLWIPYTEGDDLHSLNQTIAERRKALHISQEELAHDICSISTLSRIENSGSSIQKRVRVQLLKKVNLSGERYDYEVITENHEDYILRSQLGRAINQERWKDAEQLLAELKKRTKDTPTNRQYLLKTESCIQEMLPKGHVEKISLEQYMEVLWRTLQITFPTFPGEPTELVSYPVVTLSLNEIQILNELAACYDKLGKPEIGLQILFYIKKSVERVELKQELDMEGYSMFIRRIVSILGNKGRYQESDQISRECISILLTKKHSQRISGFLYSIAWNAEQELSKYTGEEQGKKRENCLLLMKKAYAAAKISGDYLMLQHIRKHCDMIYGLRVEL